MCNARPSNHAWSRFFVVLRRVLSELLNWKNNPLYSAFLILYSRVCFLYPVPVPDERYVLNDERRKHEMLRLLGILTLGRMILCGAAALVSVRLRCAPPVPAPSLRCPPWPLWEEGLGFLPLPPAE